MFFGDFFVLYAQSECEHVENMSPFLTCFPRQMEAFLRREQAHRPTSITLLNRISSHSDFI